MLLCAVGIIWLIIRIIAENYQIKNYDKEKERRKQLERLGLK